MVVGFGRFTTYALARVKRGVVVFNRPEEEIAAARTVPLSRIGFEPAARDSLDRLGIRTLGEFLDLPAEGIEKRFARHSTLAGIVQDWARQRFALFAQEGYESPTITCVQNTRGVSVAELNRELAGQWTTISNGYGALKEKTFRIAHMGDTQEWEIRGVLATIDRILGL